MHGVASPEVGTREPLVALAEPVYAAGHLREVHLVYVDRLAGRPQQADGELSPEVLAKLAQTVEHASGGGACYNINVNTPNLGGFDNMASYIDVY